MYDEAFRKLLDLGQVAPGSRTVDGHTVHRVEVNLVSRHVNTKGLLRKIGDPSPDIVHSLEVASLQTSDLALEEAVCRAQTAHGDAPTTSVFRSYMKQANGAWLEVAYKMTRMLPIFCLMARHAFPRDASQAFAVLHVHPF